MNPRRVDRWGKIALLIVGTVLTKCAPRIIKETSKLIKKTIPKN